MINTFDSFTDFTKKIDSETGFMHVNGVISRTGCQQYLGVELCDKLEPTRAYNVYRPKEEVLHKDSLVTFVNSTVTDNHPTDFVTTDNIKELNKGSSASYDTFNKDGIDYIKAQLVITDKSLIKKIQDGKVEISAGYSHELKPSTGTFQGVDYDFIQTDIRVNHIAIVDKGRCGAECKIANDKNVIIDKLNTGAIMAKILVGDTHLEVDDAVAGAFASLQAKNKQLDEDLTKSEKEKKDAEEKAAEEKKKFDEDMGKSDAEKEELKKDNEKLKKAGDNLHIIANDRAVLLSSVATHIGDTDVSQMTDTQIKVEALKKMTDMNMTDKSDDYIKGIFDSMMTKKSTDALDEFGKTIVSADTKVNARDAYIKKLEGAE